MINIVFLSLGSNLGYKKTNINNAYSEIEKEIGEIISKSSFYKTKPHGFNSKNYFINTVCKLQTYLSPFDVLRKIESIEKNMGRENKSINSEYSDRIIDIDILMYNNLVLNNDKLIIPHPKLHEREFVLLPLCEIDSHLIHPLIKKTVSDISNKLIKNNNINTY